MVEKDRKCIFCGKREEMVGYICPACQDRIQREVINKNMQARKEILRDISEEDDGKDDE